MVAKQKLSQIRKDVEACIGKEVIYVNTNVGRGKQITRKGVIDNAYTNLFVIKELDSSRKMSYSYQDIVTNTITLTDATSGVPLMSYEFDTSKNFLQV